MERENEEGEREEGGREVGGEDEEQGEKLTGVGRERGGEIRREDMWGEEREREGERGREGEELSFGEEEVRLGQGGKGEGN